MSEIFINKDASKVGVVNGKNSLSIDTGLKMNLEGPDSPDRDWETL